MAGNVIITNANGNKVTLQNPDTNLSDIVVDTSAIVNSIGNQTIAGVKTFSLSPIVPTPTTGTQAVNKDYADLKVALAQFTGTNQNLSANGYQKLPGGLIIQWGDTGLSSASNDLSVLFPVSFPNACFSVTTGMLGTANGFYITITGISKLDFKFTTWSNSTAKVGGYSAKYLAIGH